MISVDFVEIIREYSGLLYLSQLQLFLLMTEASMTFETEWKAEQLCMHNFFFWTFLSCWCSEHICTILSIEYFVCIYACKQACRIWKTYFVKVPVRLFRMSLEVLENYPRMIAFKYMQTDCRNAVRCCVGMLKGSVAVIKRLSTDAYS